MTTVAPAAGAELRPGDRPPGSRFFTNHAHVLMCLAEDPGMRVRDIARRVGVGDRAVTRILQDLVTDGCVVRSRVGRRSHYFVVPDPPLGHPLERHLSLEPLIAAVRTPNPTPEEATMPIALTPTDETGPLMAIESCRAALAAEMAAGWPTLAPALAAAYGPDWRAHVDAAATTLVALGRRQAGHDGTDLVWLGTRPWQTVVARFADGVLVALSSETVRTVTARAWRGELVGADDVAPGLWERALVAEPGLLGVALSAGDDWVVVDHAGERVLATSARPDPGAGDDDGDPDDAPYVVVRQAVGSGGVVPVGCRRLGLAFDLTRRYPLVTIGGSLGAGLTRTERRHLHQAEPQREPVAATA